MMDRVFVVFRNKKSKVFLFEKKKKRAIRSFLALLWARACVGAPISFSTRHTAAILLFFREKIDRWFRFFFLIWLSTRHKSQRLEIHSLSLSCGIFFSSSLHTWVKCTQTDFQKDIKNYILEQGFGVAFNPSTLPRLAPLQFRLLLLYLDLKKKDWKEIVSLVPFCVSAKWTVHFSRYQTNWIPRYCEHIFRTS